MLSLRNILETSQVGGRHVEVVRTHSANEQN